MTNKTWTIYGYFDNYDKAKQKVEELNSEYDLYKINRVRESSKEGWYKLKVWKEQVEVEPKNKKKKRKSKKKNVD